MFGLVLFRHSLFEKYDAVNSLFRSSTFFVFGLALVGCHANKINQGQEVLTVQAATQETSQESVTEQKSGVQKSIESMLNNGLQEHVVAINEVIIINAEENLIKWQLSLGRNDFKLAVFETFDNKAQKSVRLTKIGRYEVTLESVNLGSINGSGQAPAMRHRLMIVVE